MYSSGCLIPLLLANPAHAKHARRDANTAVEKAVKNDGLPEDEQRRAEAEIQKLTDAAIAKIDAHLAKKEEELMSI